MPFHSSHQGGGHVDGQNGGDHRRSSLDPATAEIRRSVRELLKAADRMLRASTDGGEPVVIVALSGGADSLALTAATAFEAPKLGINALAVVVDHGLQAGSDAIARRAAEQAEELGIPALVVNVDVPTTDVGGPEASARTARYAALDRVADERGASIVLLGHTLDDQAETVLLQLARGSGAGSLQGMPPLGARYGRPLLGIRRDTTHASCAALGIDPWTDPHNSEQRFARVRVRETVLPTLERELGPGIAEALARTAEQMREDTTAFDEMIEEFIEEICEPAEAGISVEVGALAANPAALRNRIIRYVAEAEFGQSLTRTNTLAIAALVTEWRGQGPIDVPGISVSRIDGRIVFTAHR